MSGTTWEYIRNVVVMLLCTNISDATFTGTPSDINSVAAVCRRP